MPRTGTVLGLLLRTASLGLLALSSVAFAAAPGAGTPSAPDYLQVNLPGKEAAQAFLDRFRNNYSAENLYIEFDLISMPRRGDGPTYKGRMWTARNELGPITRIEITDSTGAKQRFLIQSGADAALWKGGAAGASQVPVSALFDPLVAGLEMTPFDLQLPFFYWPDSQLLSVTRLKGRPTYLFRFTPPPAFAAAHKGLSGVRCYLDTEFAVPIQTELFGPSGRSDKTMSLVDVKKVGDLWMVKQVDVRNEVSRDKTRLSVTAVAPGQFLDMSLFEPARLEEDIPAPSGSRLMRLPP